MSASTEFTANGQTSNQSRVTVGKFIEVVGQNQTNGTWLATQVTISDRPPMQGRPQSGQGLPPIGGQGQQPGQGQLPMGGMPAPGRWTRQTTALAKTIVSASAFYAARKLNHI